MPILIHLSRPHMPEPPVSVQLHDWESLSEAYARWWNPRRAPQSRPYQPPPPRPPHCGGWCSLDTAIPLTARWAMVHVGRRPFRVLYTKSREAAYSMIEQISLHAHPHVRLFPVDPTAPEALAVLRRRAQEAH